MQRIFSSFATGPFIVDVQPQLTILPTVVAVAAATPIAEPPTAAPATFSTSPAATLPQATPVKSQSGVLGFFRSHLQAWRCSAAARAEDRNTRDVELRLCRGTRDTTEGRGTIRSNLANTLIWFHLPIYEYLGEHSYNKGPVFPKGRTDVCIINTFNEDGHSCGYNIIWAVATDREGNYYVARLTDSSGTEKYLFVDGVEDRGDSVIVKVGSHGWSRRFRIFPPQGAAGRANS